MIGESGASPRGAGAVLSIAIDPQFDRTHHVYVLATAVSPEGALSFLLARYREAGDTLADRAILLHDVPAASPEHEKSPITRSSPERRWPSTMWARWC